MRDLITNDPPQTEHLEVVLRRNGVTDLSATPEDYRRVSVMDATSPLQAMLCDDVAKAAKEGFTPLFAASPGVASGPEVLARQRTLEGPPLDRSKL
jgi:hypothetical protein